MDVDSDLSDSESSKKRNEEDEDFNIDDYRDQIDSDDSYCDLPETNKDDNEQNNGEEETEEQCENQYTGPILPGGHRFDRKFICIRYPGNVVNVDKAMETLGGITAISTAVDVSNRRLELRFRPDDVYCKPACGDRHSTTGFLLRVRIKKSRVKKMEESERQGKEAPNSDPGDVNTSNECNEDASQKSEGQEQHSAVENLTDQIHNCSISADESIDSSVKHLASGSIKDLQDLSVDTEQTVPKSKNNVGATFDRNKYEDLSKDKDYELPQLKVLGRIDTEFRFKNLCDFQYLPMVQSKADPEKLECIYQLLYPSNIPPYSWLKNEVPPFMPPAAFSRMDTIHHYVPKTEVDTSCPENVIGKNKKRRAGFTNFLCFSTPDVPTMPPPGIETAMKVKFVQNVHLDQMRQIFEERPIWSKNAIMYKTKLSTERLKFLLPSVAYYCMNGPWKIMWVRLGYDPRKDVTARKYQTLDYRLKAMHGLGSTVKCKRNYAGYMLPYKSAPLSKQKTMVLHEQLAQEHRQKKELRFHENVYIYREGMLPPSRQMFYQYCDVLVDEIQEMLAKLPDPLPGVKCHEKRGWLPSGFDVQCREIINKQVRAVLRKQMNIPEDHPTSLPRKRKRGYRMKVESLKSKKAVKAEVAQAEEEEKSDDAKPSTSSKPD